MLFHAHQFASARANVHAWGAYTLYMHAVRCHGLHLQCLVVDVALHCHHCDSRRPSHLLRSHLRQVWAKGGFSRLGAGITHSRKRGEHSRELSTAHRLPFISICERDFSSSTVRGTIMLATKRVHGCPCTCHPSQTLMKLFCCCMLSQQARAALRQPLTIPEGAEEAAESADSSQASEEHKPSRDQQHGAREQHETGIRVPRIRRTSSRDLHYT